MSFKSPHRKKTTLIPEGTPEWLRVALRVIWYLTLLILFIGTCVGGYYFHKASQFDLDEVAHLQSSNVLLDYRERTLDIGQPASARLVTFDELPTHMVDALIAREDARFMEHNGVDFRGVARAILRNLKDRSFTQGASTLTMQLARNTYDIRAKSLNRKFLETALTLRIEHRYTKQEIMAHYLNRIYFGSGCYGVEQAAQKYFGTTTKKLNLGQSALLIGIIRGPHIFSPLNNLDAAKEQRDQVLARMIDTGAITADNAEAAKKQNLNIQATKGEDQASGSYALNAIHRHRDEIIDEKDIRSGGIKIITTINGSLNERCQQDLQRLCRKHEGLQAACVVLDHQTGAVRALVGGSDYQLSSFNRALDGKMDLGDAFTPFLYAIALERGGLPIKGKPIQTGRQVGSHEILRIAKRFGFDDYFQPDGIYQGSTTTNPLELATAYACLGNGGKRPTSYFIESISLKNGTTVFQNSPSSTQVIDKGNAQQCNSFIRNRENKRIYTASAFRGRALWTMANGDRYTAVIWMGYDQPQAIKTRASIMQAMENTLMSWLR